MAIADIERVLDEWARAWSSHETERLLALFTDDCMYEDVTFRIVNRGKQELQAFADGVFASIPDFTIAVTSRFVAGTWAGMEWAMSGTHHGDLPGMPATGSASPRSAAPPSLNCKEGGSGATPITGMRRRR